MLNATAPNVEPAEEPITERTRAIMQLHEKIDKMQDVTEAVNEIRELLKQQQSAAEKFKAAIKRAVNQLMSQW